MLVGAVAKYVGEVNVRSDVPALFVALTVTPVEAEASDAVGFHEPTPVFGSIVMADGPDTLA
jgi:hypothetical protein